MKALFFIIAILCSLGGAYFAYDNNNKLVEQQTEAKQTKGKKVIVQKELAEKKEVLKGINADIKAAEGRIAETSAAIEGAIAKETTLKKTLVKYEAELQTIQEELEGFDELKQQIETELAGIGATGVDDIPEMIETLQKDVKEKEDSLEDMELIITSLEDKVNRDKDSKSSAAQRLASIKANLTNNSMTATVTSVNTEWGFVVINKGSSNSPLTDSSELLVQRYGKYVGKLKVATLETNQAICDLDLKGFRGGSLPRPGDKVILRETVGR